MRLTKAAKTVAGRMLKTSESPTMRQHASAVLNSIRTPRRAESSRVNGRKGGRPPKPKDIS